MNSLQVRKLIVVRVNTYTKEKACVATVDNLVISELEAQFGEREWDETVDALQQSSIDISGPVVQLNDELRHEDEPGLW